MEWPSFAEAKLEFHPGGIHLSWPGGQQAGPFRTLRDARDFLDQLENVQRSKHAAPTPARGFRFCSRMKKAASGLLSILGGLVLKLLTLVIPAALILAVTIGVLLFFAG